MVGAGPGLRFLTKGDLDPLLCLAHPQVFFEGSPAKIKNLGCYEIKCLGIKLCRLKKFNLYLIV